MMTDAQQNVKELKARCKANGLRGYSKLKRYDLLALLDTEPAAAAPAVVETPPAPAVDCPMPDEDDEEDDPFAADGEMVCKCCEACCLKDDEDDWAHYDNGWYCGECFPFPAVVETPPAPAVEVFYHRCLIIQCECCEASVMYGSDESDNWLSAEMDGDDDEEEYWYCPDCQ